MKRTALFCKTFAKDLEYFTLLHKSLTNYNIDGLELVVVLPQADLHLFRNSFGLDNITYLAEEEVISGDRLSGRGWFDQQIVKLHYGAQADAQILVMLDSDFYFIRPFGERDFYDERGVPLFVISKYRYVLEERVTPIWEMIRADRLPKSVSRELIETTRAAYKGPMLAIPSEFLDEEAARRNKPVSIQHRAKDVFRRPGESYNFMPAPIWVPEVLREMKTKVAGLYGLRFSDIISICPWEYYWYGEFVLSLTTALVTPTEPLFMHFPTHSGVLAARERGITREILSRHFLGIQSAARHHEFLTPL